MRFDDVVREALDSLPPDIAAGLRNVAVVVEDEDPDDPDLYGVFEGVPLTEGGPAPGDLPNRIAIFQRPLEADFDEGARPLPYEVVRDPDHRPPRARPLLRARRGPTRRAGVRVTTFLGVVTWVALVVGALVIGMFLFGRRG